MKIHLLILTLYLLCSTSYAQLAIIYDKDGYTNVRKSASAKSEVIGKVIEGQVFAISPLNDENGSAEWFNVWFHKKQVFKSKAFRKFEQVVTSGYMHSSRITILNQLPELASSQENPGKLIFKNKSSEIDFTVKPSKLIEGHMDMDNIIIKKASGTYTLPKDAMTNLHDMNIEQVKAYLGKKNELYITATGADGSDGYEVVWCIKNNRLFSMTVMQIIP